MFNHSYSESIAEAVRNHMDAHDLHYDFDENLGIFKLLMGVGGKAKTLIYHIVVDEHNFVVNVRYPLGPSSDDEASMTTMARFIARANSGMRNGNFELDMDDGDISFKSFCCCRGLDAPSDKMVAESIQCPAAMFDKYEEGILGILFNGLSDREAAHRCENGNSGLLAKLEALKARLEAMEGREEPETDDSGSNVSISFGDFIRMLEEDDEAEDRPRILDAE